MTLAGVGVAVSGTMLEVVRHAGMSTDAGIDTILLRIAAALLPAAIAVVALRSGQS